MTRMKFCGRRVNASTDDFCLPAGCSAGARIAWLVALIALLIAANVVSSAGCTPLILAFLYTCLGFNIIGLGVDCMLCRSSGAGTLIHETPARKRVPQLLVFRMLLAVADTTIAILGILALTVNVPSCEELDQNRGLQITTLVFASITAVLTLSFLCCTSACWCCGLAHSETKGDFEDELQKSARRWSRACRFCCSCCRRTNVPLETYDAVGTVLASVFETTERLGFTATDLATGLTLVRTMQRISEEKRLAAFRAEREARLAFQASTRRLPTSLTAAASPPSTATAPTKSPYRLSRPPADLGVGATPVHHDTVAVAVAGAGAGEGTRDEHKESLSVPSASASTSVRGAAHARKPTPMFGQAAEWRRSLRRRALLERRFAHVSTGTIALDTTRADEVAILDEAAHFSTYANGAYGWMIYAFDNFYSWCCKLPAFACVYSVADCMETNCNSLVCWDVPEGTRDPTNIYSTLHYASTHGLRGRQGLMATDVCHCNEVALRRVLSLALEEDRVNRLASGNAPMGLQPGHGSSMLAVGAACVKRPPRSIPNATGLPPETATGANETVIAVGGEEEGPPPRILPATPSFHHSDILHTSHTNTLFTVPWFVAVDRARGCLVVTIRGTLSLDDCITDAMAAPTVLHTHGDPLVEAIQGVLQDRFPGFNMDGRLVHGGMWRCAKDICTMIMQNALLESAAPVTPHTPTVNDGASNQTATHISNHVATTTTTTTGPDTATGAGAPKEASTAAPPTTTTTLPALQLIVCGHSLGAGVASLLALTLLPYFPELRCYAFAPPGALVDVALGRVMEAWVTTVVIGQDMIPRLSIPSIQTLIGDMVDYTSRCKVSKPALLGTSCARYLSSTRKRTCGPCLHPQSLSCCCTCCSCNGTSWDAGPLTTRSYWEGIMRSSKTPEVVMHQLLRDSGQEAPDTEFVRTLQALKQARAAYLTLGTSAPALSHASVATADDVGAGGHGSNAEPLQPHSGEHNPVTATATATSPPQRRADINGERERSWSDEWTARIAERKGLAFRGPSGGVGTPSQDRNGETPAPTPHPILQHHYSSGDTEHKEGYEAPSNTNAQSPPTPPPPTTTTTAAAPTPANTQTSGTSAPHHAGQPLPSTPNSIATMMTVAGEAVSRRISEKEEAKTASTSAGASASASVRGAGEVELTATAPSSSVARTGGGGMIGLELGVDSNVGEGPACTREPTFRARRRRFITPMSIPGRVLHMVKVNVVPADICTIACRRACGSCSWFGDFLAAVFCCCFRKQRVVYEPRWSQRRNFQQVMVSPNMISDHMPDHMNWTLQQAAADVRAGITFGGEDVNLMRQ